MNSNPFGPNPALVRAAHAADVTRYPDPQHHRAREALAELHGVTPDEVTPGVGASALLYRIAQAYLRPGDVAVTFGPPFGEFARAVAVHGARLHAAPDGGDPDVIGRLQPRLAYLSRPNNPLGTVMPDADVLAHAEVCAATGTLLILDEAYAPLLPGLPSVTHPNVVRLVSPGKAHGVVGLRLGYALASPHVAGVMRNLAPAWELPSPTEAALIALPGAQGFVRDTVPAWREHAARLAARLPGARQVHGLPFFTVHVGSSPDDGGTGNAGRAARVASALRARGVKVRDCGSYGFRDLVRISAHGGADDDALVTAWRDVSRHDAEVTYDGTGKGDG